MVGIRADAENFSVEELVEIAIENESFYQSRIDYDWDNNIVYHKKSSAKGVLLRQSRLTSLPILASNTVGNDDDLPTTNIFYASDKQLLYSMTGGYVFIVIFLKIYSDALAINIGLSSIN